MIVSCADVLSVLIDVKWSEYAAACWPKQSPHLWDECTLMVDNTYIRFDGTATDLIDVSIKEKLNTAAVPVLRLNTKSVTNYVQTNSRRLQRMVRTFPYMAGIVAAVLQLWDNKTFAPDTVPETLRILARFASTPSACNPLLPFAGTENNEPRNCWTMLIRFVCSTTDEAPRFVPAFVAFADLHPLDGFPLPLQLGTLSRFKTRSFCAGLTTEIKATVTTIVMCLSIHTHGHFLPTDLLEHVLGWDAAFDRYRG